AGLGRTHAAPAACVRTRPHPAIRVLPLEDDSEGSRCSTSIQSTGCTPMFSARWAGNIRSALADRISRPRESSPPGSAILSEARMAHTLEDAERMARALRALPAMDGSKRRLTKQALIKVLAREIASLQQRGYSIEQVTDSLRGVGLDISTPTLK